MTRPLSRNPRHLFAIWSALVCLVAALSIAANFGLAVHLRNVRAQDPRTYLHAAQQSMDKGDYLDAFAQIDEAIQRDPKESESYRLRGNLYSKLKQWDKAFDAYEQAIARGSRDEDMHLRALNALLQMRQFSKAVQFGKQCQAEGYAYPTFSYYIAEAYRALGRRADSIPYYEQALKGRPENQHIMERLVEAYRATGQKARATAMQTKMNETEALFQNIGQP